MEMLGEILSELLVVSISLIMGCIIVFSPISSIVHEWIHKIYLYMLGIDSKIKLSFFYFRFEGLKLVFVSNKKERKMEAKTYFSFSELRKHNKIQRVIVFLLPTIVLVFINMIILISYLSICKESITSSFSLLIISIIVSYIVAGVPDMIDSYKICIDN